MLYSELVRALQLLFIEGDLFREDLPDRVQVPLVLLLPFETDFGDVLLEALQVELLDRERAIRLAVDLLRVEEGLPLSAVSAGLLVVDPFLFSGDVAIYRELGGGDVAAKLT